MEICDIKAISKLQKNKCILVVDNTFMSPYNQRPIELGIIVGTDNKIFKWT